MAGGAQDLSELEKDPRLFLYTSLTAGSSHIITATSRLETILKANKIPFLAIDTATDEKARRLWARRAGKRKIPGLVKEGFVLGDLEEIEEWNEFGELHENIGPVPPVAASATSSQSQNHKPAVSPAPPLPINPTATAGTAKISPPKALVDETKMRPLPGAAEIAARNNPLPKSSSEHAVKPETMTSAPAEKEKSIEAAKAAVGKEQDKVDDSSKEEPGPRPPAAESVEPSKEVAEAAKEDSQVPFSPVVADSTAGKKEEDKVETKAASDAVPAASQDAEKDENRGVSREDAEDDTGGVAEGVEGLQVGEGKDVQSQQTKEPDDAGKSVED